MKCGKRGDSGRMKKKRSEEKTLRERKNRLRGGGRGLPTRLKETYPVAWEEIDRDCTRNSGEEDEK